MNIFFQISLILCGLFMMSAGWFWAGIDQGKDEAIESFKKIEMKK